MEGKTIFRKKRGLILISIVCLAVSVLSIPHLHAQADTDAKVLRVGVRAMNYNPSFLERFFSKPPKTGPIHGLMGMLESLMAVRVKYVVSSTHVERRRLLHQGKIDVIAFDSPQLTSDQSLDFVFLGLHINRQLFVHKSRQDIYSPDDLVNVNIAVLNGDNYMPHLNNALGSTLAIMSCPHRALQALNAGEVDAYLAPSARTAENIINLEGFHDVVKVGLRIEQIEMSLAVRKDNPKLKEALGKAVKSLGDSGQLKVLHEKWYDVHYTPSPWRKVFRLGMVGIALAVLAMLLVIFMNLRLKSRVIEVTKFLRNSEERYRGLIHSAPDLVIVLDRDGVIRHSNPVADQLMGSLGKSIVDSKFSEFVRPGEGSSLTEFIDLTFAEKSGRHEFKLVDHKGVSHEVDMAARVLPASNGDHPRICCFARDVTQRNMIERELVQTDRMSTIGKMAAGIAHEINNPVGIVQANVALLLARNMYTSESKEFLEAIQRNSVRAGQITQELLAMAKPKTPEMRLVNLEELIKMSLDMLGGQLKDIEVVREPAKKEPVLMGDPNLLQQVLVNLFLNAISAMKSSETRRLLIRFCPNHFEDTLCFRIEDSGSGIEKHFLNEIFEPFFTFGKKEGFGLGLFISRRIIEKHDGIIFAESDIGKGAQFIIELPAYNTDTGGNDSGVT